MMYLGYRKKKLAAACLRRWYEWCVEKFPLCHATLYIYRWFLMRFFLLYLSPSGIFFIMLLPFPTGFKWKCWKYATIDWRKIENHCESVFFCSLLSSHLISGSFIAPWHFNARHKLPAWERELVGEKEE